MRYKSSQWCCSFLYFLYLWAPISWDKFLTTVSSHELFSARSLESGIRPTWNEDDQVCQAWMVMGHPKIQNIWDVSAMFCSIFFTTFGGSLGLNLEKPKLQLDWDNLHSTHQLCTVVISCIRWVWILGCNACCNKIICLINALNAGLDWDVWMAQLAHMPETRLTRSHRV